MENTLGGWFQSIATYHGRDCRLGMMPIRLLKLVFSQKIIMAKIKNQTVILKRYARHREMDVSRDVKQMLYVCGKIEQSSSISQIMGFEGYAARLYFGVLGRIIDTQFQFKGRNTRPPRDPFNAMVSLGYTILMNEIYGGIEAKGLNPFWGLMHKDKEHHPALASDLMEEWRAVLVDSTVLSMLNGHEICIDEFDRMEEGVYLKREGFRKFVSKLESKLDTSNQYLSYVDYGVSFRMAVSMQIGRLMKAMEENDLSVYSPVILR